MVDITGEGCVRSEAELSVWGNELFSPAERANGVNTTGRSRDKETYAAKMMGELALSKYETVVQLLQTGYTPDWTGLVMLPE